MKYSIQGNLTWHCLLADVPVLEEAPVLAVDEFEQFMASVGQQATSGNQLDAREAAKQDEKGVAGETLTGKILCECDQGEHVFIRKFAKIISQTISQLRPSGPRSLPTSPPQTPPCTLTRRRGGRRTSATSGSLLRTTGRRPPTPTIPGSTSSRALTSHSKITRWVDHLSGSPTHFKVR